MIKIDDKTAILNTQEWLEFSTRLIHSGAMISLLMQDMGFWSEEACDKYERDLAVAWTAMQYVARFHTTKCPVELER
jgi:hypothetical protein